MLFLVAGFCRRAMLLQRTDSSAIVRAMSTASGTKFIRKAVKVIGSQAKFAETIGVSPQEVWQWCSGRRPVPAKYCLSIEEKTGVLARDLLPEVFSKKAA
jgi:DNA-binding transcriptional regulator YiaG